MIAATTAGAANFHVHKSMKLTSLSFIVVAFLKLIPRGS